jgi:hypothetical protein
MSTISSKPEKRRVLISPDMAFFFALLIGVIVVLGVPLGHKYDPLNATETLGTAAIGSDFNSGATTFAADEQYWEANCSHGWSSNARCDDILSRAKLCEKGLDSAYCSDYANYMQRIHDRMTNNFNL